MIQSVLALSASLAALKGDYDRALACCYRLPPSTQATEMLLLMQQIGRALGPLEKEAPPDAPTIPPDLHTAAVNIMAKIEQSGSGKPSPLGGDEAH